MKYLLPIIIVSIIILVLGTYNYDNVKTSSEKEKQSLSDEDFEKDFVNSWEVLEKHVSKKEFVLEYYEKGKIKLKTTFSNKEYGWDTFIREEWFDDSGNVFVVAPDSKDKDYEYKNFWDNDSPLVLKCSTETIGEVIVERNEKLEVKINNINTKSKTQGTSYCRMTTYYFNNQEINIAYRPALSGCHNNEYFPMYHQGTIYLSKKQPSTSQQDWTSSDILSTASEVVYCQK